MEKERRENSIIGPVREVENFHQTNSEVVIVQARSIHRF